MCSRGRSSLGWLPRPENGIFPRRLISPPELKQSWRHGLKGTGKFCTAALVENLPLLVGSLNRDQWKISNAVNLITQGFCPLSVKSGVKSASG